MADILDAAERETALNTVSAWSYDEEAGAIVRDFKFKNFVEAFAFMTQVALLAEKADHHPDWSNTYNRVSIRLSTHDAGGLTVKDIALAKAIDALGH